MRVIRLWTSACSTAAIVASGTLTAVPTGRARSASIESMLAGSRRTTRAIGWSSPSWTRPIVWGVMALRTSPPTWAAVSPTPRALLGSTRTWTSGRASTRSLTWFARPGSRSSAARTASAVSATTAGVLGADDDGQAVRRRAALHPDRDLVAVAADGREPLGELIELRLEVHRRVQPDHDLGTVGGPARRRREDRLEPGIALAGHARGDEIDIRIGHQDRLGVRGAGQDLLGAGAGRRRDGDLGDLLRARVDERRRQERHDRRRGAEQDRRDDHGPDPRDAVPEHEADRRVVGADPQGVLGLAGLVDRAPGSA